MLNHFLEYLMTTKNKTKLICVNNKKIIAELNPGEQTNLLDNNITLKLLDASGDFFVFISENVKKTILLNGEKIFDAAQGKSGDHLSIEENDYIIIANDQAVYSHLHQSDRTKKIVEELKSTYQKKESKKKRRQFLLASLIAFTFSIILIYQFYSLGKPHVLISGELPPDLVNYQYLSQAQIDKIRQENNLIEVDTDIEESYEKPKAILKKPSKKTSRKIKKHKKNLINFKELNELKDKYLDQVTRASLNVLNKIGSAFNKHIKHIDQVKSKPQLLVFWKAWNLGMIAQLSAINMQKEISNLSNIDKDKQIEAKEVYYSYTKYAVLLDEEALKQKKEYEQSIQKKIDSILLLSQLNPREARFYLKKLEGWVPTNSYLFNNIRKQINSIK